MNHGRIVLPFAIIWSAIATVALADNFNVINTSDSGPGSLRQAILDANAHVNVGTPDTIIGCTESEVRHLEKTIGLVLPESYKDFLRAAGKCAGAYDVDGDWLYPELLTLKEKAVKLLNLMENGKLSLPEKAFVCAMGTPEGFAFFETGDPLETGPIFSYYEQDRHFTRVYDSFWNMLEEELPTAEHLQRTDSPGMSGRHERALRRARKFKSLWFRVMDYLDSFAKSLPRK